jgi:hypothetical protein
MVLVNGDDFSKNLFTDLGPLLALFGAGATTQFLSRDEILNCYPR